MTIDDLVGAAYLPTDGQANPSDITQSLAKGARMAGVKIFEDTPVTRVIVEDGRIRGVETPFGTIECEKVICCAGQWTRTLAASVGVNVPLVSVEHQYMITEKIEGVTSGLPTLRDPDRLTYWKEDVGGLVWGGYEPNPKPWAVNGFGIAWGGGAGMALAEWAAKGEAPYDLWPVDIRRFGKVHQSTDWVRTRTLEAYGKHYTIAWPSEEMKSARPTRRSPLYAHLKAAGAC